MSYIFLRDDDNNSLIAEDVEHWHTHEGHHFFVETVIDLAQDAVYDVQWTTPNTYKWGHFTFKLNCEAETEWYIYEGATISVAGTTITPLNNNRNSSATSTHTLAYQANTSVANANSDTAVGAATTLAHGKIGSGGIFTSSGGIADRATELVLKQNTIYCMRAIGTAAGYVNFLMNWYEWINVENL